MDDLIQSAEEALLPVQPELNEGNASHECMTWLFNTTVGPYRLTPRVIRAFIVCYIGRFEHMHLPEPNQGKLCFHMLQTGPAAAGKSFVYNMVMTFTLPGVMEARPCSTKSHVLTPSHRWSLA